MDSPMRFRDQHYLHLYSLLEPSLLITSYRYAVRLALTGRLTADAQCEGSLYVYGDPLMDTLLEVVKPAISAATGLELLPTYSYLRIYLAGTALGPHTDRDACEITVSVCLGCEPESTGECDAWPMYMRLPGTDIRVGAACRPGDGLVFRGRKLEHWREPFVGEHQAMVFLHYVDEHGPFAALENDGREMLGMSPAPCE